MKYVTTLLIIMAILVSGCAKDLQSLIEIPEPITFEQSIHKNVDTKPLDVKVEETVQDIYTNVLYGKLNSDGKIEFVSDESDATFVILKPEDYSKVADLIDITIAYQDIVHQQNDLSKTYVDQINSLKNIATLERQMAIIQTQNWKNSEGMYIQEHKIRIREKILSDVRFVAMILGGIAVTAL